MTQIAGKLISAYKVVDWEKIYVRLIEWGVYAILFTPLIYVSSYFFPFVSPKSIFFRAAVDFLAVVYILLVFVNKRYLPKWNSLLTSVSIFLAVLVFTSFLGINFSKSFWSEFERMTGLLTFFHLFAFLIIIISVFKEKKYWERIIMVAVAAGVLESLYVLFYDEFSPQGGGTLGNTTFLTAYLLFTIFFATTMFLASSTLWKRIYYASSLVPMLWVLLFPAKEPTKGAILAFFIGIFILAWGSLFFSKKKQLKYAAVSIILFMILLPPLLLQFDFFKSMASDVLGEVPGRARLIVWQMGFEAFQERPWFGWGQENFNVPFAKYFNPELVLTFDLWYDRVHNIFLDLLTTSGIVGLVAYFAIFFVALWKLVQMCFRAASTKYLFVPLGMIAVLAVYVAQNVWVFDMIPTYLMFFLTLGFIYFLIEHNKNEETEKPAYVESDSTATSKAGLNIVSAILLFSLAVTFYYGNLLPARASVLISKASHLSPPAASPLYLKAADLSPIGFSEAAEWFAQVAFGYTFDPQQDREQLLQAFSEAADLTKSAIEKAPEDLKLYLFLSRLYSDHYFLTQSEEMLEKARITANKAIELSPGNPQPRWVLAQTYIYEGKDYERAIDILKGSIDLVPGYAPSYWNLAKTYSTAGQFEKAAETAETAEEKGYMWTFGKSDFDIVADIYESIPDYETLLYLLERTASIYPANADYRIGLAFTNANLHKFDLARKYAEKAKEMDPSLSQRVNEFLNSLPR